MDRRADELLIGGSGPAPGPGWPGRIGGRCCGERGAAEGEHAEEQEHGDRREAEHEPEERVNDPVHRLARQAERADPHRPGGTGASTQAAAATTAHGGAGRLAVDPRAFELMGVGVVEAVMVQVVGDGPEEGLASTAGASAFSARLRPAEQAASSEPSRPRRIFAS